MNTGGPAFPASKVGIDLFNDEGREIGCRVFPPSQGMSLLDYMAGQALAGLLANPGGPIQANGMTGWGFANCNPDFIAGMAHELASAMLAEKARMEAAVKESSTTDDAGRLAKLEALNRELVWALDIVLFGWVDDYDDAEEVVKARAILDKARGIT